MSGWDFVKRDVSRSRERKRRSTQCRNKAEAARIAREWELISILDPAETFYYFYLKNTDHAFMNMYFWSQQLAAGKTAPFQETTSP